MSVENSKTTRTYYPYSLENEAFHSDRLVELRRQIKEEDTMGFERRPRQTPSEGSAAERYRNFC